MRTSAAVACLVLLVGLSLGLVGCSLSGTATPSVAATPSPGGTAAAGASGTAGPTTPEASVGQASTGAVGTRKSPAQMGQTVPVTFNGNRYEVTFTETVTGQEAYSRLQEDNSLNQPPAEGHEYLLAYFQVGILETAGDLEVTVSRFDWGMVDSTGKTLGVPSGAIAPSPSFVGAGSAGATIEGWTVFERRVNEEVSLVFGMRSDGSGGAWFTVPGQ